MLRNLVEIPPEAWRELCDLYNHQKLYVSSFNTLQMCVDWFEKNNEINKEVKIYSLDENWRADGTFIMYDHHQLIGNTLNEDLQRFKLTLQASKCLDVAETFIINGIRERVFPAAEDYFCEEQKSGQCVPFLPTLFYHVEPQIIGQYDVSPPQGYKVLGLKLEHAKVVNSHWPHSSPASMKYVERLIRYNLSVGAFNNNDELVAWCLFTPLGSLGLIQVHDAHKRLGLGSLMVRCIAQELMARGIEVTAPVMAENLPSRLMFDKLGFKVVDNMFWAFKKSKNNKERK